MLKTLFPHPVAAYEVATGEVLLRSYARLRDWGGGLNEPIELRSRTHAHPVILRPFSFSSQSLKKIPQGLFAGEPSSLFGSKRAANHLHADWPACSVNLP